MGDEDVHTRWDEPPLLQTLLSPGQVEPPVPKLRLPGGWNRNGTLSPWQCLLSCEWDTVTMATPVVMCVTTCSSVLMSDWLMHIVGDVWHYRGNACSHVTTTLLSCDRTHHGDPHILMPLMVVPESSRYVTFSTRATESFSSWLLYFCGWLNRRHRLS